MSIRKTLLIIGAATALASQVSAAVPVQVSKGETVWGYSYRMMETEAANSPYIIPTSFAVFVLSPDTGTNTHHRAHDFYGAYGITDKITFVAEYNRYNARLFDRSYPIKLNLYDENDVFVKQVDDTVRVRIGRNLRNLDVYGKYAISKNIALMGGLRKIVDENKFTGTLSTYVWRDHGKTKTYTIKQSNVDKKYLFGGVSLNANLSPKIALFGDYKITGDWREYVAGVSYSCNKDVNLDLSYKDFKYDKDDYKAQWKGYGVGLTWKFK